jgi:xylulokinase
MLLLGIDLGSSSVKASIIDGNTGSCLASAFMPEQEMEIIARSPGWAEQDTEVWFENLKAAVKKCTKAVGNLSGSVGAIGISYQMHGLVAVDRNHSVLRPSIIWCDSRAVKYGQDAFERMGAGYCLKNYLNSPGNFTASKLAWVKENEPELFSKIHKIMLPGDYIALRLTGYLRTTVPGLSEGIMWDIASEKPAEKLFDHFGFPRDFIPDIVPSFSVQGSLLPDMACELGLKAGIPVSYRAGDQPNNALSLNVLEPGEVAATAGTSGVIYGVSDTRKYDPLSRVNTFVHVNHSNSKPRLGVLLCINGTGILNSWARKYFSGSHSYTEMNELAMKVNPGADGLFIHPFGNGAERMLGNTDTGASISGLNFNIHGKGHIFRAVQEGIAFSFRYGLEIMKETGINPSQIRAGDANMFLSPLFRELVSNVTGCPIELYNTDGSIGAARGAGIGCGFYKSFSEAFDGLKSVNSAVPENAKMEIYDNKYREWLNILRRNADIK